MQIGFIGLGKMGIEMATRAVSGGHDLLGLDMSPDTCTRAQERGIPTASTLEELLSKLAKPCVIWLQTPPGQPTQSLITTLSEMLAAGDTVVDGGNSDFRDSVKAAKKLADKGIKFMDVGVSGGVSGAKNGCGMLIGADKAQFAAMEPFFRSLAAPGGYALCGGVGAGHYAKTIHNGVEYAIMQAYAEGYEMLCASEIEVDILAALNAYQSGCSIRSHILGKIIEAVEPDATLHDVEGFVADNGMGRWTLEEAIRLKVPTPAIAAALQARFRSQQEDSPAMQCIAALRGTIGGHPVKRKGDKK